MAPRLPVHVAASGVLRAATLAVATSVLAPAAAAAADNNATWTPVLPAAPWAARVARSAVGVLGDSVFLVGGANASVALSDVWRSPDSGASWAQVVADGAGVPGGGFWPPRSGGCVVSAPGFLALLGGYSRAPGVPGAGRYLSDTWTSADGAAWVNASGGGAAAFPGRSGHACAYHDGGLWVLGGLAPAPTNDVWRANAAGAGSGAATWVRISAGGWAPRGYAAAASYGGLLWVVGGTNLSAPLGDAWTSPDGRDWTALAGVPWAPRDSACLVAWAGVLWLLGGRTATGGGGGGAYAAGDTWRTSGSGAVGDVAWGLVETAAPWGPRADAGCAALDTGTGGAGTLVLLGGQQAAAEGGGAPSLRGDVWAASANLLCEEAGVVCGGHGVCNGSSWAPASGPVVLAAHTNHDRRAAAAGGGEATVWPPYSPGALLPPPAPAPLPVNCTCDDGWMDARCVEPLCNPRTCVHGTCVAANASLATRVVVASGRDTCVCDDPTQWVGPACDTPVCAAACSADHGGCSEPGGCDCESGWGGPTCGIPLDPLHTVGVWVTAHVAGVFVSLTTLGFAAVLGGLLTARFPGLLSACVGLPIPLGAAGGGGGSGGSRYPSGGVNDWYATVGGAERQGLLPRQPHHQQQPQLKPPPQLRRGQPQRYGSVLDDDPAAAALGAVAVVGAGSGGPTTAAPAPPRGGGGASSGSGGSSPAPDGSGGGAGSGSDSGAVTLGAYALSPSSPALQGLTRAASAKRVRFAPTVDYSSV